MIKLKKIILSFAFIIFVILIMNFSVMAASPNFQIKPSRFEILLEPRNRIIETVEISNKGKEVLNLVASAKDWDIDENSNLQLMDPSSTPKSASNWIRFNPKKIKIDPGKSQLIRFSITAPPKIEAGEYKTTILLTAEETIETDIQVNIRPQFAILVYVNIPEVKRKGEIVNTQIRINEENEYVAIGDINSIGNAHLRISGEYILKNEKGKDIKNRELDRKVILAGDSEQFKAELGELKAGDYTLKLIWHYIPAFYMEGEYDEYPGEEKNMIKEYEFSVEK